MLKMISDKLKKRALFKKYKWSVRVEETENGMLYRDILVPIDQEIDPAVKSGALFDNIFKKYEEGILINASDAEDIKYTMLPNTISVNDKLLTIQMDSMGDVPKIWYKGKEITGRVHISFDWKTKDTDVNVNPTYIKIKYVGKDSSKLDIRTIIHNNDAKDCR